MRHYNNTPFKISSMNKTENIIAIIAIIALGLKLIFIEGSGLLTVITFMLLSIIYFYFGFALFNNIKLRKIFKKNSYNEVSSLRILGAVGSGAALSMTTLGIMYKFQSWEGAEIYLGTGLIGLLIIVVIGGLKYSKNKDNYYSNIFKRVAVFGSIGLILMLMPQTTWIAIKYRNEPAYVDAYKKAAADPENKELWDKVEEELERMKNNRQE